jgi:hypothetical protein
VTDSATFTTPENEDEDLGEDLGGLDDLLASVRSEDAPKPKRGRGRAKKEAPAKDFKAVLWESADKLRAQMDAAEYKHLVLGLVTLAFGGLQVWWVSSVFRRRDLARTLSEEISGAHWRQSKRLTRKRARKKLHSITYLPMIVATTLNN